MDNGNDRGKKGIKRTTHGKELNKPVYLPELLENIKNLRNSGIDLSQLSLEHPAGEADLSKLETEAGGAGRLMILLRKVGDAQDDKVYEYFDDLEGKEWIALFRDVLNCPTDIDGGYAPGDSLDELDEKIRLEFQVSIPEFPMLARIWDTYIDIAYGREEINELRNECLKVQRLASSNEVASRGLTKLINACDEALRSGGSLELACN